MKLAVEWDFKVDDDDEWNALSYEEQREQADIPDIITVPAEVVDDYQEAKDSGDDAEYVVSEWLSDEFGWCHYGWEIK